MKGVLSKDTDKKQQENMNLSRAYSTSLDQLKVTLTETYSEWMKLKFQSIVNWYDVKILYYTETVLVISSSLLWWILTSSILLMLKTSVFATYATCVGFKFFIIVSSFIICGLLENLWERHRCLQFLLQLMNIGVPLDSLLSFHDYKKKRKTVAKALGEFLINLFELLFVLLTIFTGMNITITSYPTVMGRAVMAMTKSTLKQVASAPTVIALENSFGMMEMCSNCVSKQWESVKLLPVTSKMIQSQYIYETNYIEIRDDFLAIKADCMVMSTTISIPKTNSQINITKLEKTTNGSFIETSVSFFESEKLQPSTYKCTINVQDLQGDIVYIYNAGITNALIPNGIDSIKGSSQNCTPIASMCFERSTRQDLSYNFFTSTISVGNYTLNHYSLPKDLTSASINVGDVSEFIATSFSNILKLSFINFENEEKEFDVKIDSIAVAGSIDISTLAVYLLFAAVYTLSICSTVIRDLYLVKNVPNIYIDRMKKVLYPGKEQYHAIFMVMQQTKIMKQENDKPIYIHFGEDKSTQSQEEGWLRFGFANELIPFSPQRKYYS